MLCLIFNRHNLCLNLVHLEPLKSFQGPIKELHLPWPAEHWQPEQGQACCSHTSVNSTLGSL